MASFQVKRRDTGIIYSLQVTEFVFRNAYSIDRNGILSLDPTGFVYISKVGDNIAEKLGVDALEQGAEFYFVNNPEYYLKATVSSSTTRAQRIEEPAVNYNDETTLRRYINYQYKYMPLDIYNSSGYVARFMQYAVFSAEYNDNHAPVYSMMPNFLMTNEPLYKPTFAFNFTQKFIGNISPYYYRIQSFAGDLQKSFPFSSPESIGNCSPIYYGDNYSLRTGMSESTVYGMYDKNVTNTAKGINTTNIKKYADITGKEYTTIVSGGTSSPSANIFNNYQVQGMTAYDFFYSLLFDTLNSSNPYPDNPDNPNNTEGGQSKPNIGGNPSGGGNNSDSIIVPTVPTVNPISTGSVNLYQMSASTFRDFMKYLWSNPFYTAFIKLFQDPMEAVISAHIIGAFVPTNGQDHITIGNVETSIQANVVSNNFVSVDFGVLNIPEYYQDSSDYLDTVIELYLPYYGYVTLNPYEVMGANIQLRYTIDILTGAFNAFIVVQKTVDGTNLNSVLYQYNGNMAYQIPLSSVDYSTLITASISAIGALGQKKIGNIIRGITDAALSIDIGYDRAGTLSGNVGYMSVKQAYVTILRPIHNLPPNFSKYIGYPYEGYVNLGSCIGLTMCRQVFIDNIIGTEQETEEIKRLLQSGVIF